MDGSEAEHDYGSPIPGKLLPTEQWASTAIKKLPPPGPLEWQRVFGRQAPLVLDLGCGNGRFVIASALRRPECDHLGVEILPVVIRYATKRANQRGLTNARLAVIGAHELLQNYVAPVSVAEIHLYHPQPYHNQEQAFRRLITPEFLALVRRSLQPEGFVVVQTDDKNYWKYIRHVAPLLFNWQDLPGRWPDAPAGRTRREIYARQRGLPIFKGRGSPRMELTEAEIAEIVRTRPAPNFSTDRDR